MSSYDLPNIPYVHNIHEYMIPQITKTAENQESIINLSLIQYSRELKKKIEFNPQWDNFKRYTNPYEFIHSNIPNTAKSVSSKQPLSRSYYKMVEFIHTFNLRDNYNATFHLAEGPGGFIEAIVENQKVEGFHYGTTLINSSDNNIPGWRKTKHFLEKYPNVKLEYGKSGTGDITDLSNLQYCYNKYKDSMELITGDGGFDFSTDFNNQESNISKLIFCQISFAIAMQKVGGTFILKLFDVTTKISLDMLYLLSIAYENVTLTKPNTSRHANSEKYVVCRNFRLQNRETFIKHISSFYSQNFISLLNFEIPLLYKVKIEDFNAILGQQQLENIVATINLIHNNNSSILERLTKQNVLSSTRWCEKYNIPFHINKQYVMNI